jgi:hypothetical protein
MPVIAAGVGCATKLLVIEMRFASLKFEGIGRSARRAAKMAMITVDRLTKELLNRRELFDLVDAHALARDAERYQNL